MSVDEITVVVPVGPHHMYKKWLNSCLFSIERQSVPANQVIIVDDMANLNSRDYQSYNVPLRITKNPWLLGPYASWNIGVALSQTNMVLLMGSDDMIYEDCIERVQKTYRKVGDVAGFYNLTCDIGQSHEKSTALNNAAVVTKNLWRLTGGFPLTANLGGGDALLISIMMVHMPEHLHQVDEGEATYWVREHEFQDTRKFAGTFPQQIVEVRDVETRRWEKPIWTT